MSRLLKRIATGLLLLFLAALAPGSRLPHTPPPTLPANTLPQTRQADPIPPAVYTALQTEQPQAEPAGLEVEIQAHSPAQAQSLQAAVAEAGGEVLQAEGSRLVAWIPQERAEAVLSAPEVATVSLNEELSLDPIRIAAPSQVITATQAGQLAALNQQAMGTAALREQVGARGQNVVVAVIDSGVDPVHPALQQTSDGKPKLVSWKDFTGEGLVKTPHLVAWEGTYTAPNGTRYMLPPKPAASQNARFGFWDELTITGVINSDLDRNGSVLDRFGVLLVDSVTPGLYDTVYVDTNNDGSFANEQPLRLYNTSQTRALMGRLRPGATEDRRLGFVIADLDPRGQHVTFGFDGQGHGTQVAGVLGANGPDGLFGVAPDVQIMALKAIRSTGTGNWFDIKQAIRYAAQNGANIINVSLGGLAAAAAKWDSGASEELNRLARDYGVLIILAADNTGPGLSSGATLGSPSDVLVVGSYYSPEMWQRDFGSVIPAETIWALSGMGPRSDGSYVPSVVAPGGSPTTSPLWLSASGYTTAVGTSIATPHASGAAALLMEAGRRNGFLHDRMSIKRALEMGARRIAGFGVYEQGHGLISLGATLTHLRQIDSVPQLSARSPEGNPGLLARSYRPGSTAFMLTNRDAELARVGVVSLDNWVRPGLGTMTLPSGVARELPVQFTPPQEPGVHSSFLTVTHLGKYGPSLIIPITYVRPVGLSEKPDGAHTFADRLQAGRYRRYFCEVAPGSSSFTVTNRVTFTAQGAAEGTVQVHIFRPDGQAVHRAEIGAKGTGLSTIYQTEDPVPGVWEIVVTALPDPEGKRMDAAFTLETKSRPGAMAGQPLRLNVPAGSTTTHSLQVTNIFAAFTGRVEVVGLTRLEPAQTWNRGVTWRVERSLENKVEDFTLREFTSRMRVEVDSPIPAAAELTLYVYYLDPVEGWRLRGRTSEKTGTKWAVELTNLPAGRYAVHVDAAGSAGPVPQFQYRRLMAVEGYHFTVSDAPRRRQSGESWNVALTLRSPLMPGRYLAQVLLRDTENGATLGWFPLEVSVGEPALRVEPMVSQLRRGQPGSVVLEVLGSAGGQPPAGTLLVNQVRYVIRSGRVTVPVTPEGDRLTLDIRAELPGYQFYRQTITLPVRDSWGQHPIGIDPAEELGAWRNKVTSQLRGTEQP